MGTRRADKGLSGCRAVHLDRLVCTSYRSRSGNPRSGHFLTGNHRIAERKGPGNDSLAGNKFLDPGNLTVSSDSHFDSNRTAAAKVGSHRNSCHHHCAESLSSTHSNFHRIWQTIACSAFGPNFQS